MLKETDFIGLTLEQKDILENFYKKNKSLYYSHKSDWIKKCHFDEDKLMIHINTLFSSSWKRSFDVVSNMTINDTDYVVIQKIHYIALYDVNKNIMFTYELNTWKTTGLNFWLNTNGYYGVRQSGTYAFAYQNSETLKHLNILPEYKYIDFAKLKNGNLYILLNERFNKSKLWQIEMLIKDGYIQLASDLASSYQTIDFKILKQYSNFFRKKYKTLDHYNDILALHKEGLQDPEFIYLNRYIGVSSWNRFGGFINLLLEHPELNRNRFLKYIKGRKGQETLLTRNFLHLYYQYLDEIIYLKLDLSKDKYAFPQDLVKAMQDHLLSINPYEYRNGKFTSMFESWQENLPVNERSDLYEARFKAIRTAEKKRQALAKKRVLEKQKFLKFLWDYNSKIRYEIDDIYVLVAPTSSEDLLIEGKTLNHCVYSYVDKIGKRESNIYFLRKKGHEDKPFYTVEIKNGVINQCRSTNNQINPMITEKLSTWYQEHKTLIPSWDLEKEVNYGN